MQVGNFKSVVAGAIILAVWSYSSVTAENWPQWRGAHHNGICNEKNLPTDWNSAGKNVLWKTEMPGPGGATPVIWNDEVYVTSAEDANLLLLAYGRDGKLKWKVWM